LGGKSKKKARHLIHGIQALWAHFGWEEKGEEKARHLIHSIQALWVHFGVTTQDPREVCQQQGKKQEKKKKARKRKKPGT